MFSQIKLIKYLSNKILKIKTKNKIQHYFFEKLLLLLKNKIYKLKFITYYYLFKLPLPYTIEEQNKKWLEELIIDFKNNYDDNYWLNSYSFDFFLKIAERNPELIISRNSNENNLFYNSEIVLSFITKQLNDYILLLETDKNLTSSILFLRMQYENGLISKEKIIIILSDIRTIYNHHYYSNIKNFSISPNIVKEIIQHPINQNIGEENKRQSFYIYEKNYVDASHFINGKSNDIIINPSIGNQTILKSFQSYFNNNKIYTIDIMNCIQNATGKIHNYTIINMNLNTFKLIRPQNNHLIFKQTTDTLEDCVITGNYNKILVLKSKIQIPLDLVISPKYKDFVLKKLENENISFDTFFQNSFNLIFKEKNITIKNIINKIIIDKETKKNNNKIKNLLYFRNNNDYGDVGIILEKPKIKHISWFVKSEKIENNNLSLLNIDYFFNNTILINCFSYGRYFIYLLYYFLIIYIELNKFFYIFFNFNYDIYIYIYYFFFLICFYCIIKLISFFWKRL